MALRVLLVGDDVLARAGLLALLMGRGDLSAVGQASSDDGSRFREDFDVVLWDAGAGSGVDAGWLEDTDRPVVALVADPRRAAAALVAGARGVLPRDAPADRVATALLSATEGLLVVDEAFAGALLGRRTVTDPLLEPLTPREIEVLGLLAEGLANKTIAARLAISESTVKFHVNAILGKLGAGNRSEAIVQAARRGLVTL